LLRGYPFPSNWPRIEVSGGRQFIDLSAVCRQTRARTVNLYHGGHTMVNEHLFAIFQGFITTLTHGDVRRGASNGRRITTPWTSAIRATESFAHRIIAKFRLSQRDCLQHTFGRRSFDRRNDLSYCANMLTIFRGSLRGPARNRSRGRTSHPEAVLFILQCRP